MRIKYLVSTNICAYATDTSMPLAVLSAAQVSGEPYLLDVVPLIRALDIKGKFLSEHFTVTTQVPLQVFFVVFAIIIYLLGMTGNNWLSSNQVLLHWLREKPIISQFLTLW